MKFVSRHLTVEAPGSELAVFYAFEGKFSANTHLKDADVWFDRYFSNLFSLEQFSGKANETAQVFPKDGIPVKKILLVGLGKKSDLKPEAVREYGGTIGKSLKDFKAETCTVFLPEAKSSVISAVQIGQTVTEGILLGSHTITEYKSDPKPDKLPTEICLSPSAKGMVAAVDKGRAIGEITAWAQNTTRELVSQPAMFLTPTRLAKYAERFAAEYGFKCKVLSTPDIKKLKMGCLLAVNAGSDQPPKFIVLEYIGPKAHKRKICLVGKGITFDSGGYSLKDAANMLDMKGDMAGSACVLTSIAAAARLKLPVHVIGLIPTTENLVSGKGYKPGDILTSYNGKTIEITNTDAEGRLILADGLGYADTFKPDALIDIATLTGAAKIALGYTGAAYFSNDDRLARKVENAAEASCEKVWRMPLWEGYQEYIKSDLADIKNSAGRAGSLCTSAAFLANFVGNNKWAHIDIAGVDVDVKGGSYVKKGSSGLGARLLIDFLRSW
ncbi:MAG: leucyl aminopeptidase [Candidatus Zixiibacteriota bacterium]